MTSHPEDDVIYPASTTLQGLDFRVVIEGTDQETTSETAQLLAQILMADSAELPPVDDRDRFKAIGWLCILNHTMEHGGEMVVPDDVWIEFQRRKWARRVDSKSESVYRLTSEGRRIVTQASMDWWISDE